MADNSVDAVVTDPPYGMSSPPDIVEVLTHWLAGDDYHHRGAGFMGREWDAFVPGPAVWKECLRVLKPGGYLLAFAAPRTVDLMGISLRLGGFELRDTIIFWGFGTGFPKSMNVAKAIDKAAGRDAAKSAKALKEWRNAAKLTRPALAELVGCTPASIRDWEEGRVRTTGKPPEFLVPSQQYRDRLNELCSYGTDTRTITSRAQSRSGDGSVIGLGHTGAIYGPPTSDLAKQWEGWGTALKPAYEPILCVRKPLEGNVANNVLLHGTGAINIDASRIPTTAEDRKRMEEMSAGFVGRQWGDPHLVNYGYEDSMATKTLSVPHQAGRFPANVILGHHPDCVPVGAEDVEVWDCHPDCPVRSLDEQSGILKSGKPGIRGARGAVNSGATYGAESRPVGNPETGFGDMGGASRFFYCAKASKSERSIGLDEGTVNMHPTVKPIKLMDYLVNLVTPPGGVVLDPYCGSGTTMLAAVNGGFTGLGIDRDDDGTYLEIAAQRVAHAGGRVTRKNPSVRHR